MKLEDFLDKESLIGEKCDACDKPISKKNAGLAEVDGYEAQLFHTKCYFEYLADEPSEG